MAAGAIDKFSPKCSNRRPAKKKRDRTAMSKFIVLTEHNYFLNLGNGFKKSAACITLHPGFEAVCLNPWVLQIAYYVYRQQYGGRAQENSIHEHTAYRQLVRVCWQFLGKEVRVFLPSCAVRRIRAAFPSEQYEVPSVSIAKCFV
ncbi:uncharacterized protein [Apostichopus japonicus]|uniref:uncharacterized protein n=1 Tax=Stichopus japonicus TaxID=307972 RepID=UPI003AB5CD91